MVRTVLARFALRVRHDIVCYCIYKRSAVNKQSQQEFATRRRVAIPKMFVSPCLVALTVYCHGHVDSNECLVHVLRVLW